VYAGPHLSATPDRQASSFVGRLADLDAIAERFEDGAQLVTITGLGGMGKTRVAQRFAEAHAGSWAAPRGGGVWFCDLTAAHDATTACAAVASVLGLQLDADEATLADQLGRALSRRGRTLLVLDNLEQLGEHAGAVLGRWLTAAPRARFLVTSRVALGLAAEHLWPRHPLELPPSELRDEAQLAAIESVDLFVRRARQRRPDLPLGRPRGAAAVRRRVGGHARDPARVPEPGHLQPARPGRARHRHGDRPRGRRRLQLRRRQLRRDLRDLLGRRQDRRGPPVPRQPVLLGP